MIVDKNGLEVTEDTWKKVDFLIKDFIRRYPVDWYHFRRDITANQTKYQLAQEGDLKKASFRNTLSFPVIMRKRTEEEIKLDPVGSKVEFVESIKEHLDKVIPGFTAPDEGTSKNKLYKEFIKRYHNLFCPGELQ